MKVDAIRSARTALEAGLYGGALVWLVESVDRAATLWPSFNSLLEPFVFAAYLAPTILAGLAAGVAIGAVLFVLELAWAGARRLTDRLPARVAPVAALALATAAVGLLVRLALEAYPDAVEAPLFRLVRKINGKLVRMPFVVEHFSALLLVGIFVAVAAGVLVALALAADPAPRRRVPRAVGAVALFAGVCVVYGLDSRFLYGRYESVIHVPATVGALALAFLAAGLARGLVGSRRALGAGALAVLAVGLLCSAFDLAHVGENENLKALLWRRGVVARHVYRLASAAWDRDRDGFSPLFGGGDLDDHDPNVNPLATEIPGNGVDDNCVGGDGAPRPPVAPAAPALGTAASGHGKSFLFVGIDTLRANRMSVYGYERPTSPRIAEWSASGLLFERCYAEGTNTGQTFATWQRSATRGNVYDWSRSTMFGTLRADGYRTAQVNARRADVWLDGGMWADYLRVILDGVDRTTHQKGQQLWDGDKVTDAAIAYLSTVDPNERSATWVHYLDPHAPRKKMAPFDFGNSDSDKYDTEVAFSDREVGRLLDWMRDTGRLENTIVVLMADHGESFGEHGMVQHGNRPYDEQIHVPLVVWAPGVAPGRVATPVSTLDVAPTVLAYLGEPGIAGAEGIDLLSDSIPERPIVVETPRNGVDVTFFAYAVHEGTKRLIYDVYGNTTELYDLASDPLELHNLADSDPETVARMRATLARWLDSTDSVRPYEASAADDEGHE